MRRLWPHWGLSCHGKNIPLCKVENEGGLLDPSEISARVRQGCLLSRILLLVLLDIIVTAVVMKDKTGRGIQWYLVNKLKDLDYADGICLTTPTLQAMKTKLKDLTEEVEVSRLRINIEKTKETE
jgi:hypothetical protein